MMALIALGGPPYAPGDFQQALLERMEPTMPTEAVTIFTMAKGDRSATEVHPCHNYALLSIGSMIRPCYFIPLLFHEQHEASIK